MNKNMKKAVLFVVMVLFTLPSSVLKAQGRYGADSVQCIKYLSYYQEYFKNKQYSDALPNWRKAYNVCPPKASQNMLLHGMTLVRQLIGKNSANKEYKAALVDTLMTLHNQRILNYPKYMRTALNSKGQDVFNYYRGNNQKLHEEFSKIINANKSDTKPSLFVYDFNAAVELYRAGKLTTDQVMDIYQYNLSFLSDAKESEDTKKAKAELENRFIASNIANCENLLNIFTPKYAASPEDLSLAKNIVKMLSVADNCTDNDLYLNAVSTMHKMEPSYNSAYYLYRLNAARGSFDDAVKYMKESIAYEESDTKTDAEYSFELATFCFKNGRSDLAYEFASSAAALDDAMSGKAYFLIGNIWGSTKCGGDEIASRAPFWVAVDYMVRAKNADPTLTEEANKYIGMYSKYFPQTAEAFMYDLSDGKSYTVVCKGMRANTTVRTQK